MKKDVIQYGDFQKLDIRIGEVVDTIKVENSNKLLKLTVNAGEEYGVVTIFTAMAKFYTPEDFKGKKFAFILNLEPKKIMDEFSQGMILAVDDNDKPVLVPVDRNVSNGSIIR